MNKKLFRLVLPLLSFVFITSTLLTGCGNGNNVEQPNSQIVEEESKNTSGVDVIQEIGQGSTVFGFEVTDNNDVIKKWSVHTNEKTVGAALVKVGLISGDESEHGLYIKEVNGLRADYDKDNAYWAFYVDGDYASKGVDSTDIEANKTYSFVYTKE